MRISPEVTVCPASAHTLVSVLLQLNEYAVVAEGTRWRLTPSDVSVSRCFVERLIYRNHWAARVWHCGPHIHGHVQPESCGVTPRGTKKYVETRQGSGYAPVLEVNNSWYLHGGHPGAFAQAVRRNRLQGDLRDDAAGAQAHPRQVKQLRIRVVLPQVGYLD